jgi:Tol biopolymer transport system component
MALAVVSPGGQGQLWVQALDALSARPLPGTEGASHPFWSPDGRSIAFFQGGRLRRIDSDGGTIQTICEGAGTGFGGSWGTGGTIVFGSTFGEPLWRVPASGGSKKPATVPDRARGDSALLFPTFLPDGRHFVVAARNVDPVKSALVLADLESTESRVLWQSDSGAVWAPTGHLLFAREGTLFAQKFDPRDRKAIGEPFSIVGDVRFFTDSSGLQAAAGGDLLAYGLWRHERRLVWVDRTGRELGTIGQVGDYEGIRISPSGDRVAATLRDPALGWSSDVWVLDVGRGIASRVTSERTDEFGPVWSPDGRRIYYTSERTGRYDLRSRPSGGGDEEIVLLEKWDTVVNEVTPDGRSLVLGGSPTGEDEDVWLLALAGDRSPKAVIESRTFVEKSSRLSPDGRWVAFTSDEPGRESIYVAPWPSGPKQPVSDGGGSVPVWSRDGKELYYLAADGRLTAVSVSLGSGISFGAPQPLFELDPAGLTSYDPRPYDVAPNGHFLVVRAVGQERSNPIVVDVHWTARRK